MITFTQIRRAARDRFDDLTVKAVRCRGPFTRLVEPWSSAHVLSWVDAEMGRVPVAGGLHQDGWDGHWRAWLTVGPVEFDLSRRAVVRAIAACDRARVHQFADVRIGPVSVAARPDLRAAIRSELIKLARQLDPPPPIGKPLPLVPGGLS
ncbi:hypothetical protein [Microlunatus parietis]|uniref:Uncharacterized protein n=1 Tax=Microlunatus parietis TaxID=682979 RepID=A0A7Y9I818_9ACTN|nr:hypothetical protein [Microlunatus parietis]NYE71892.1 hypothetical protein [Microlunatus parietis]